MAPLDTGLFEMSCNSTSNQSHYGHHMKLNCNTWKPPVVGTLDHFDHIIIPGLAIWTTQFDTTVEEQAVKLFSRNSAFAGDYLNLSAVSMLDSLGYYETNILGNPRLPYGVSFLIGNFHTLFGTDAGRQLQLLAMHYSWPLVWGLGGMPNKKQISRSSMSTSRWEESPMGSWPGNQRILDPMAVAAGVLNVTIPISAEVAFTTIWAEVENRRKNPLPIGLKHWSTWWEGLASSQTRLAPVTAKAGCSEDLCFGTNVESGECVCRQVKTLVI